MKRLNNIVTDGIDQTPKCFLDRFKQFFAILCLSFKSFSFQHRHKRFKGNIGPANLYLFRYLYLLFVNLNTQTSKLVKDYRMPLHIKLSSVYNWTTRRIWNVQWTKNGKSAWLFMNIIRLS